MMAKALHRQPPSIALNPFLREMALFGAWFLRTFLGKEEVVSRGTLRNAQHSYYFDASKSKEELGIEYRDISDTIAETCKLLALASQEQYRPKYLQLN